MNTESVNCRNVADYDHVEQPGDFYFKPIQGMDGENVLHIKLPGGSFIAIGVNKGAPGGPRVWGWDGNEDKPTITPSINCIDHWHGFLRAGRLESC